MNFRRTLIERHGRSLGIAIHERHGCRFFAADPIVKTLDGTLFPSLGAIDDACRKLDKPNPKQPEWGEQEFTAVDAELLTMTEGGLFWGFPFPHY